MNLKMIDSPENVCTLIKKEIYADTDPAVKNLADLMRNAEAKMKLSITYFPEEKYQSTGVSPYNLVIDIGAKTPLYFFIESKDIST